MLSEYQKLYNKKPNTWLRFIDDIFFVWSGDEKSLKHFLTFCNNFSNEYNLKSSIKFTYTYSEKEVNFLDTKVEIEDNGSLSTNLYCKPSSAHQYLNKQSSHPPHTIKSIPKSQFIRIRRICSFIDDYNENLKS